KNSSASPGLVLPCPCGLTNALGPESSRNSSWDHELKSCNSRRATYMSTRRDARHDRRTDYALPRLLSLPANRLDVRKNGRTEPPKWPASVPRGRWPPPRSICLRPNHRPNLESTLGPHHRAARTPRDPITRTG